LEFCDFNQVAKMTKDIGQKSPVASMFYKNVPVIAGKVNDDRLPFSLEEFASMSTEMVYVLDFFKRKVRFVSDRNFFLCGHSVKEVLSLGYDFYPKIIHKDDMPLLEKMHAAILRRLCDMDNAGGVNYFTFSIRFKNESGYLLLFHKLKPVFVDGQIRYGICLLSSSADGTPGHLRTYYYIWYRLRRIFTEQWNMDGKNAGATHKDGKINPENLQTG